MAGAIVGGMLAVLATVAGVLAYKIDSYVDPYHNKVTEAGFLLKSAQVNRLSLSYAEGPDNGPPLVLLHAQHLDWFSYSRVMPALSRSFHVFVIDYPGHGATRAPADYPMTANQIGADLADFIQQRVGAPVYISGNSSGGLLTVWLAANRPQLVRAALLEDPPLFSSEYPRIRQTIAAKSFATSYKAVHEHSDDFLLYWIHASARFFRNHVGPGTSRLLTAAVHVYRHAHPGQPVEIGLVHNDTVRLLIRGLDRYDPRFGAAFYDGSWNQGFSHADALQNIRCPTLLMQANTSTLKDGTLDGAMSEAEAARARGLLRQGQFVKVDATHVINLDQPEAFVQILEKFFLSQP
ncbi:alpha/beta fold hydrolase [Pseudoduganella sp. FT26W]|uniref:Alpha/beta fold hydrolase n=2 Tax=Duganella aquatilis TaxID=2666082 RepID=A0A844D3V5_9BURK|nr:alpha/beta fold hydrolase [Duganella aquatilis]